MRWKAYGTVGRVLGDGLSRPAPASPRGSPAPAGPAASALESPPHPQTPRSRPARGRPVIAAMTKSATFDLLRSSRRSRVSASTTFVLSSRTCTSSPTIAALPAGLDIAVLGGQRIDLATVCSSREAVGPGKLVELAADRRWRGSPAFELPVILALLGTGVGINIGTVMRAGPVPRKHPEANPAASRAPTRATPAPSAPPASGDGPGGNPGTAPGGCQGRHFRPPSATLRGRSGGGPGGHTSGSGIRHAPESRRRRRSHQRPTPAVPHTIGGPDPAPRLHLRVPPGPPGRRPSTAAAAASSRLIARLPP